MPKKCRSGRERLSAATSSAACASPDASPATTMISGAAIWRRRTVPDFTPRHRATKGQSRYVRGELKTVLLAEHHAPTLEHVRSELTQAGYSVKTAADPGRAMELFVSDHPDFVVVAVEFPRLDGAHLGKLVRGSDHGKRVPMIAIDKAHLGKAKGVGAILDLKANAYVADPTKGELV